MTARTIRRLFVKVRRPRPDPCWFPNAEGFLEELRACG